MIIYRIAYIGDADTDILYKKAQEYFDKKNSANKDFKFEFEDISNLSELEIVSKNYHMGVFDINILDTNKAESLKRLIKSVNNIADFDFHPVARTTITETEIGKVSEKINDLSEHPEKIRAIPINISNEQDIEGYLDSIDIMSEKYYELASDVIDKRRDLRSMVVNKTLQATKRKDEIDGKNYVTYDHILAVSNNSKAFAKYLGWNEDRVANASFIGYVHDVAKIIIPTNVLNARNLTIKNEIQQMAPHDELGGHLIGKNIADDNEKRGVTGHHGKREKNDNEAEISGDNDIVDLITLIDSSDAMTSQRTYNNPKNIVNFLEQLESCSRVPNWQGKLQFQNRFLAEEFIAFNVVELAKIGYDVRAMIELTLRDNRERLSKAMQESDERGINNLQSSITVSENILGIIDKHKEQIQINDKAEPGATTALGYRLTEEGHLEYSRKTLKPDPNIRVNSEFEFKIKMFFQKNYKEEFDNANSINELIDKYVQNNGGVKEETPFWKSAVAQVSKQDEYYKNVVQAGKVRTTSLDEQTVKIDLASQILNSAKEQSSEFNINQLTNAVEAIKDIKKEREVGILKEDGTTR